MANFRNIGVGLGNFNPQNTQCIPVVKILARLDLAEIFSSLDGHKLVFTNISVP
jgi:hypothetical protein